MPVVEKEKINQIPLSFMEKLTYNPVWILIFPFLLFAPLGNFIFRSNQESYSHAGVWIFGFMFTISIIISLIALKLSPKVKNHSTCKTSNDSIEYCSHFNDTQIILLNQIEYVFKIQSLSLNTWIFVGKNERNKLIASSKAGIQEKLESKKIKIIDLTTPMFIWVFLFIAVALFTEKYQTSELTSYLILGIWLFPFLYLKKDQNKYTLPNQTKYIRSQMISVIGSCAILLIGPTFVFEAHSKIDQNIRVANKLIKHGDYVNALSLLNKTNELDRFPTALNNQAWLLTTAPETTLRDYQKAEVLAEEALMKRNNVSAYADTLACAKFALGKKEEALEISKKYSLNQRLIEFQDSKLCEDTIVNSKRIPASASE